MAEFGENLKRVREEKGITQQTLADYLYVTRQAVSRWEGGSRYPDIMTAKKIAQFLEVSLDELLSDDDMHLYVKNNAILDSSLSKKAQMVMVSLAFMCALIHSIIYFSNYLLKEPMIISASSGMIRSILLTFVLGYSVYVSLYDKLNAKVASYVSILYFGSIVCADILVLFEENIVIIDVIIVCDLIYNLLFLLIYVRFFQSKSIPSPVPIYVSSGISVVGGCFLWFFYYQISSLVIPNEYYIGYALRILSLIEALFLFSLLSIMAYVLHKKRKLAVK